VSYNPTVPGLFRASVKPSESIVVVAVVLAIGLTFEFARSVWLDSLNGHHINFAVLPLYWLMWNVLPLILFAIGKLLQKQGRWIDAKDPWQSAQDFGCGLTPAKRLKL